MKNLKHQRLLKRLGYEFSDPALLNLALTHRSCGSKNNERVEFLGDSILNFVIGEALFKRFPEAKEGQLSRLRSQLVKGETLAKVAREFDLGECLILGEGEMKSGGHRRDSILADAVEAIIGAIHLDGGFEKAKERTLDWFSERLASIQLELKKDPKTELQELLQSRKKPLPEYSVAEIHGEAHSQEFTIECRTALLSEVMSARASNRRTAEKLAAAAVLEKLQSK